MHRIRYEKSRYIRDATNVICTLMTTTDHDPTPEPILGLVLAGGLARRMGGGDKPMRTIAGRSMLQRVIDRVAPQCNGLVINANGDAARFAAFDLAVIPDTVADFPGPLAGILAGLDWAAQHRPDIRWMLSAPGDCPFLPRDLALRLHNARRDDGAQLAVAASGGQTHPVVGLWDVALRHKLREALVTQQLRQVGRFMARYHLATIEWPVEPLDPFFNANTVDDLTEAERLATLDGD
jgi:molybdopterin-guanine dinucleotide biosynthesis protein A